MLTLIRQLSTAALLFTASSNTFGQLETEPSTQPSVGSVATERLFDNIARLLSADSLAVAALEKEQIRFELTSYGTYFIPNLEHSTSYAVVSAFDGIDTQGARLSFHARFSPSQSLVATLHLPLKKSPEFCITQAEVRNRFGGEQRRGWTPHVTTLSYKPQGVTMMFDFTGNCAHNISLREITRSAQAANNLRQYPAPTSHRTSVVTISELLTKLATLRELSPEGVGAHLQTRVALSATVERLGILQRRETHYKALDIFDDNFQGNAELSLNTPLSSPAIENASLRVDIARPSMNCVEPIDLTKHGAVLEQIVQKDRYLSKQTLRTPVGLKIELTYARNCISTIVVTHQTVRK